MNNAQLLVTALTIIIFIAGVVLVGAILQWRNNRQSHKKHDELAKATRDLLSYIKRIDSAVAGEKNEFKRRIDYLQGILKQQNIDIYRQVKFAEDIDAMIGPGMTRNLRGWAISPDALLAILHYVEKYKPKLVLELGGGYSTVALARLIEKKKLRTKVVSVDHDAQYLAQTKGLVGNSDAVAYVHAPLIEYGEGYRWYDVGQIKTSVKKSEIDCVVVDGPPESTNPFARRPVLKHLKPLLATEYAILLDDAARPDEKAAVEDWRTIDARLTHNYVYTEKGLSVLSTKEVNQSDLL